MNDERLVYVSEREAGRLWKRAAELQVEESRKVEERSRDLHAPPGPSGFPAGQHLLLEEVLLAAREVGIGENHLEAAVAELQEERAAGGSPTPDLIERLAARFFGSPPPALEATAILPATPAEVYGILQVLLPADPYRLRLRGVMGDDPLRDGVLVFDAPEVLGRERSYVRETIMAADRVKRLYVTLRACEAEGERACRLTVRGRIDSDPEPAFWIGSVATAGGTALGGAAGAVVGAGLGLAGVLLAGPAAVAAAVAGVSTYVSIRNRYLRPLVRGLHGLDELLEVVQAAVKTRGGFLSRASDDPERGWIGAPPGGRGGHG